jgi:regulator of protease activity HflC (stomatin/prohibitin superfamily)
MIALVFSIILFIVAVIAVGVAVFSEDFRIGGGIAAVVCTLLGVVILVFSCYDRVDTRNVGIITSFGRPVGVHEAGIVWHAPWKKVSELSEAIQLQSFESNSYDEASKGQASPNAGGPAINVRLANNSNAFVDLNLNWRIREGAAAKMFQDYGGGNVFDTIRQQLVDRQAQVMASKVFATFNPQTQAQPVVPTATPATPPPADGTPGAPTPVATPGAPNVIPTPMQGADLPRMAAQVKKDLQDAVGTEIEILDVRIPRLWYDQPTQQRIDQFNQQVQETLNSAQQVKTAEQQRLAAEQRANQPPPDLRIAIFNCLNDQVKNGRDPAGCWGQIGGQPLVQIPR